MVLYKTLVVDIAAGKMRAAGSAGTEPGVVASGESANSWGPDALAGGLDFSEYGPGGMGFSCTENENLEPRGLSDTVHVPGPGEPGFTCAEQENLEPRQEADDPACMRRRE